MSKLDFVLSSLALLSILLIAEFVFSRGLLG